MGVAVTCHVFCQIKPGQSYNNERKKYITTNKEYCFENLHLYFRETRERETIMRVGSKVLTLSTITISQPACPAHSGHVSHVTQRTSRDLSQNLGNRKRLEDVIRPLKTRPRELQVHLQTGVVQACGSQPPVDHINLKIEEL